MSEYYNSRTVAKSTGPVASPRQPRKTQNVWIRTSTRRSSLARLSMQMKSIPAYIIYASENQAEQRFDIVKESLTVGRMTDRDIVLQCQDVSKDHASIEKDEHG